MILIDQQVEKKLTAHLEQLRDHPDNSRCIYVKLAEPDILREHAKSIQPVIFKAIFKHISLENPHIYLCEDGDIFILAPHIPTNTARIVIAEISAHIPSAPTHSWISLVECATHINRLLVIVEKKILKQMEMSEEGIRRKEEALKLRKKQQILHITNIDEAKERIKKIRSERKIPELMMIEDDLFSRRLVENVLSKQFHITSISEATYALETYIRIVPNLLFLDINLPDVTGHELLEKIIQIDPDAYVVMLSGNRDRENIMQAMNNGAQGFIAKPFTREKLFQYIDRCPTISAS